MLRNGFYARKNKKRTVFEFIEQLSPTQNALFRELVKKSDGTAILLVHPLFDAGTPPGSTGISQANLENLLFSTGPFRDILAVVLEDCFRLERLAQTILEKQRRHYRPRRRMVFECSEAGFPDPAWRTWEMLIEDMKYAGINSVLVCGKLLRYFDRRSKEYEDARMEEQEKQVEALERRMFEKTLYERARKFGLGAKALEREKAGIEKRLALGAEKCVGETYKRFVLSRQFETVRILNRYCR